MSSDGPEDILATALLADADAHERERFHEIGERYDDVFAAPLPLKDHWMPTTAVAFEFWDGWVDARNHGWHYYPGISRDDWPRLARDVARSLRDRVPPTDPTLTAHFGPAAHPAWRTRFREWRHGRFPGR